MRVEELSAHDRRHLHLGRQGRGLADDPVDSARLHRGVQALHRQHADGMDLDAENMMYGSLFMLCGAYTLAQNAHVRGDFLYASMRPRTQAALDLVLYVVFFLPGIAALVYAGYSTPPILAHQRALQRHRQRPAGLPFQGDDPARRHPGAAPGHRRNRALHRLPQDRRMAEPAEGRRRNRRGRRTARAQRIRRRGIAQDGHRGRGAHRRNAPGSAAWAEKPRR